MLVYGGGVNQVYPDLVRSLIRDGRPVGPRGTQTLELNPIVIQLDRPRERVVTSWGRPINVTFALAEVLWILLGRRDVEMLAFYNESIRQFSDDGLVFNAPYGYRLRKAHTFDQLLDVEMTLHEDRDSRQGTLCIWHPRDRGWHRDPELRTIFDRNTTKDRACNVLAHAMIRDDALTWLQVVRSNDVILGVPYNFIQWTCVQEYLANRLEVDVGPFTYIADSMHLYTDGRYYPASTAEGIQPFDLYEQLNPPPVAPIGCSDAEIEAVERWEMFLRRGEGSAGAPLGTFWDMAAWMFAAHRDYRDHNDETTMHTLLDEVHPAYGLTQMKFYFLKRWTKHEGLARQAMDLVEDRHGGVVSMWLTDFAHVKD